MINFTEPVVNFWEPKMDLEEIIDNWLKGEKITVSSSSDFLIKHIIRLQRELEKEKHRNELSKLQSDLFFSSR